MWDKFKNDEKMKEHMMKLITVMVIVVIALLSFDVLTTDRDGRRQIVDEDGGTEAALCAILGDIKGVGNVDVLIQYSDDAQVTGVIVTSQGAGNAVVRNNLTNAVSAVFNIPISNVMSSKRRMGE